jgi:malate synthase
LRLNVSVGIRYLVSWLTGVGAAAIDNLMEDVATAEICRAQIWQWVHNGILLESGERVTTQLVRELLDTETARLRTIDFASGTVLKEARLLFEQISLAEKYVAFLTIPAYELVD